MNDNTVCKNGAVLVNALFDSTLSPERGFQLGLLYLDTYLKSHGFNCHIIAGDETSPEIERVLKSDESWILVGFYLSADNVFEVERVCRTIRKSHPETKLIIGGPQARVSFRPFLESELVDYACISDGEDCILQLMKFLSDYEDAPGDLSDIPALAYLDNGVIKTSRRLYLSLDLDRFPIPDRSAYDTRHQNFTHICTSRGCASKCTFCYEGTINKIKRHSVERVIREIELLKTNYRTRYFTFVDDTFTTDKKKVMNLCNEINSRFKPHVDVTWYCECKPSDIVAAPWMAEEMVKAGLIRAQIGSETGVQEILDTYQKGMTVEDTVEATSLLHTAGINSIFTNFIIAGSQETYTTFEKTCEFASELFDLAPGVLECAYSFLSPYAGTDVRENPTVYNLALLDTAFVTGSSDSYVFAKPGNLTKDDVLSMGSIFRNLILQKFEAIYPSLPIDVIRNQIYYSGFGVRTNWFDFIISDPIQYTWLKYLEAGYAPELPEKMPLGQIIPVRTLRMDGVIKNTFEWKLRQKRFIFRPIELRLLELCAGKIDLSTLLALITGECDQKISIPEILNILSSLARENFLLFRLLGK